jgi:hypothetical protein
MRLQGIVRSTSTINHQQQVEGNMENTIEKLEGCMCEYIPDHLRNQIETLAEKTNAYTSQVVTVALQIGLAVLIGKTGEILRLTSTAKHGPIKQTRKAKLSGKGI